MGYSGCPCYQDFFITHGYYCDDDDNGISCADCPLVELARQKS